MKIGKIILTTSVQPLILFSYAVTHIQNSLTSRTKNVKFEIANYYIKTKKIKNKINYKESIILACIRLSLFGCRCLSKNSLFWLNNFSVLT